MSDTNVIIQPETPSSPQTIIIDVLLLALEYGLVKWLIKKWDEYTNQQGPPVGRCVQYRKLPPWPSLDDPSNPQFVFYMDYVNDFIPVVSLAHTHGYSTATFRLVADAATYNTQWQGWNWHVEMNIDMTDQGGYTIAKKCYLWYSGCPGKHIPADPDSSEFNNYLCGCMQGDDCQYENNWGNCQYSPNGMTGIFYSYFQKWRAAQQNAKLQSFNPSPLSNCSISKCTGDCGSC